MAVPGAIRGGFEDPCHLHGLDWRDDCPTCRGCHESWLKSHAQNPRTRMADNPLDPGSPLHRKWIEWFTAAHQQ